mgnify:FL=1
MGRENTGTSLAAWTADYRGVRYTRARYAIYAADGRACLCCGATGDRVVLSLDHVVPDVAGGSDEPENLVTVCVSCNSRRRDLTVPAYARRLVAGGHMTTEQAEAFRARVRAAQRRHESIRRARAPARRAA